MRSGRIDESLRLSAVQKAERGRQKGSQAAEAESDTHCDCDAILLVECAICGQAGEFANGTGDDEVATGERQTVEDGRCTCIQWFPVDISSHTWLWRSSW